ncbi:hypothetical protein EC9_44740 [Rosistilla ulvae]|uniref:Putative zinc-finger domain-containing protein n=1 Tax=Rosistilla ulvae TaxID=1930277 RepID=A0A517M5X2_9BACT|nr:zf-HC2 domain-containing protein [Rosistilla ulvae]QDS90267.1 hypothetical protein EC9_44740 [Rosistilla ulvae]
MNRPQTPSDDWQPCQPGTLQRLADQQRRTRRVGTVKRIALPAAAVMLLIFAGISAMRPREPQRLPHGGLSCAEVAQQLHAFAANQVDAAMAQKISDHMLDCPRCRHKLQELQTGTAARTPAGNRLSPTRQAPMGESPRDLLALADRR